MKYLLAAASALVLASGANAASSVAVNLNNFSISATRGSTLGTFSNGFGAYVYDQNGWVGGNPVWSPINLNYSYGSSVSVSTAKGNQASASVAPNGYTFLVKTSSQGGVAEAELNLWGELTLAAHGTLTLQWDRTVVGTNDGQPAAAGGIMFVNGMVVNTSGRVGSDWKGFDPVYALQSVGDPAAFGMSTIDHQKLTFTNDTDAAVTTDFQGSFQIYTRDAALSANVPEPEEFVLCLAGIAVVGGANLLRRRRG